MTRLGPLLSPVLVGRDDLLEQADRRVADAAAGRGRLLLLAGEAGIGKSRLIGAIGRRAAAAGFGVADGRVAPQDVDVPAASILDLARTMVRLPAFDSLGRALLDRTRNAPDLTQGRRRAFVRDLTDLILGELGGRTMLWFDDLQWTDEVSLDVIGELARAAAGHPLLVVAAYRTDELPPGALLRGWRSRLLAQRLAEEARLTPLSLEQTGQMAALILGEPVSRDVAAALYERTDGVPLHIEELLGALDRPALADARAVRDAAVPQTIEDAVLQRVGRLSAEAQSVARAGAVIGRCFVPEVLAGIMDLPVDALDAPLHELVDHDVLEPPGPPVLYDFRHQLLRDALYRTVPSADLRRFHARAAEFGRRLEGASEVHASLHFERAGMHAEAFRSALAGAEAAARVLAHREALDLYRRAIQNMPPGLPPAEKAAIFEAAGGSAAAREDIAGWKAWAEAARQLHERTGDRLGVARAMLDLGSIERRAAGPIDERLSQVEEILAVLATEPESAEAQILRSDAYYLAAIAAIDARDLPRATDMVRASRLAAEASGSSLQLGQTEVLEGTLAILCGDLDGGRRQIETEARRALRAGEGDAAITAFRWLGDILVQVLDYKGAIDYIEEGIRYGDSIEQSFCPGVLSSDAAIVAWGDGRWEDAVGRATDVLALRGGSPRGPAMARIPLALVALGRGDLAGARRLAADGSSVGDRRVALDLALPALWVQAEAALLEGDHSAVIAMVERAAAIGETTGERAQLAPFAVTGARALLAAGRPGDAARWVERLARILEGTPWAGYPALGHARGLVALADGATGVARASLERAVAGWDSALRVWEGLWARLDLALALVRAGRNAEAAVLVSDVRERAVRLDSRPLLQRADEIARQARGRAVVEEPWHPLSTRELEVARLIAAGMTNAEIALELGMAPKTASSHVEHILAKLGATRRTEIASWVARLGMAGSASRGR